MNKPNIFDKLAYLGIYPSDLKTEAFFPGRPSRGFTTGDFPRAVYIIHKPTGTRFESTEGCSQLINRDICLEKILKWAEEKRAGELNCEQN